MTPYLVMSKNYSFYIIISACFQSNFYKYLSSNLKNLLKVRLSQHPQVLILLFFLKENVRWFEMLSAWIKIELGEGCESSPQHTLTAFS